MITPADCGRLAAREDARRIVAEASVAYERAKADYEREPTDERFIALAQSEAAYRAHSADFAANYATR